MTDARFIAHLRRYMAFRKGLQHARAGLDPNPPPAPGPLAPEWLDVRSYQQEYWRGFHRGTAEPREPLEDEHGT